MVLGQDGRLVWIVDGYMTSDAHPYSRSVEFEGSPAFNYIRNSVKATVDAYDGTVKIYVFDPERSADQRLPESVSGPVPAGLGDAGRICARMCAIRR